MEKETDCSMKVRRSLPNEDKHRGKRYRNHYALERFNAHFLPGNLSNELRQETVTFRIFGTVGSGWQPFNCAGKHAESSLFAPHRIFMITLIVRGVCTVPYLTFTSTHPAQELTYPLSITLTPTSQSLCHPVRSNGVATTPHVLSGCSPE